MTDWLSNVTDHTYDDAGRLTQVDYPNGVTTTYTYDDDDRLLSVTNSDDTPAVFSSFTYTLDAVGNGTQVVDNAGTTTFDYDAIYRLTEVTYPGPTTDTYTYDANGDRLTKNTDDYTMQSNLRGPRAWPDVWALAIASIVTFSLSVLGLVAVPGLIVRVLTVTTAVLCVARIRGSVPAPGRAEFEREYAKWDNRLLFILLAIFVIGVLVIILT